MASLWDAAPTILSFLGGPAGGLVGAGVEFLADKLGATDKTKEGIQAALSNADPLELRKLDYDFQKFCLSNGIQVQLAQIGVNTEEAKSTSTFVSGWRPFCGWVGGFALCYVAILEPIGRFIATVGFNYHGAFPVIDTSVTVNVLMGMLGLAGLRTVEKSKGVASQ